MLAFQISFDEDMLDRNEMDWLWALGYFSEARVRVRQLEISLFLECRGLVQVSYVD